jgi:putrescine transport system substrate-binding protein
MQKTLAAVLSATLAVAPVVTHADGPTAGDTLRVYNWSDYIGENTLADFQKATGIRVIYDTFDSYETVQGKLLPGRSGYDLVLLNAALVPP